MQTKRKKKDNMEKRKITGAGCTASGNMTRKEMLSSHKHIRVIWVSKEIHILEYDSALHCLYTNLMTDGFDS
jgi:hypothetical protein